MIAHQPSDPFPADTMASCKQFGVDARAASLAALFNGLPGLGDQHSLALRTPVRPALSFPAQPGIKCTRRDTNHTVSALK